MSKQDLVSPKVPKDKWGPEARICSVILDLQTKFCATNLMQDYIEGKLSLQDVDLFMWKPENIHIQSSIFELKREVFQYLTPDGDKKVYDIYHFDEFQVLNELGTILADSPWWERYIAITGVMGVECVLSIRTAESLFKRDPKADEIRTALKKLVEPKEFCHANS